MPTSAAIALSKGDLMEVNYGSEKRSSRILDEMHETAQGLHGSGLISKRRMGEFDVLCHLDVHELSPRQIKSLRERSHLSQAVLAAVLNISPSTVQKWESGAKKPSGPSLKMLNVIERKGIEAVV
jgi:putative transcriptional regulator